jgi:sugar-specific transcriptional regulator TrmB
MLDYLTRFGLPEKEAKVYLALLELGPSSVSEVAKRAKVSRTNTYHLLNALLARGLVNSHEKTSKIIFSAEGPERILQMLKSQAEDAQRVYSEAKDLMPELKSVFNKKDGKLSVRFYEGVEGIISAYEDTLGAKSEIQAFASVENQHSFFPGYFPAYYNRRTKNGISVRCLLADSEESRRIQSLDKAHLRKSFIVPDKYAISPEINIYDNKVAIMSLSEKFGAVIESQQVKDAFQNLFDLAFERAEQYDKELKKSPPKKSKRD